MGKTSQSSSGSKLTGRGKRERRTDSSSLGRLSRRFATFRRKNQPGTRIPDPLRNAIVAALREGATRSAVQETCGVSWAQIDRWVASCKPPRSQRPIRAPRVFSVVDDTPSHQSADRAEDLLELRLGGWSICIRPVGSQQSGSR
jgi:hypothetical protein